MSHRFLSALILLPFLTTLTQSQVVTSFFESSSEGWAIANNGGSTSPDYTTTDGNPGGAIFDTDAQGGIAWFFVAPAKFRGDHSDKFDKLFRFDIRQEQNSSGSQFGGNDIVLNGNGLSLRLDIGNDGASGNPPVGQWTDYEFFFNESEGWKHAGSGAAADNADIQSALSAIDDLWIRGEFLSGPIGGDTAYLDNVEMGVSAVPEPSSLILSSLISIGGGAYQYRKRRLQKLEAASQVEELATS